MPKHVKASSRGQADRRPENDERRLNDRPGEMTEAAGVSDKIPCRNYFVLKCGSHGLGAINPGELCCMATDSNRTTHRMDSVSAFSVHLARSVSRSVRLCLCLSLCPSLSLSLALSVSLCVSLSHSVSVTRCLSLHMSVSLTLRFCLSRSVLLSRSLSVSVCLSLSPPLSGSRTLPVCLSLSVSHTLSVPLSLCLSRSLCLSLCVRFRPVRLILPLPSAMGYSGCRFMVCIHLNPELLNF